jgi:hypothetical protein
MTAIDIYLFSLFTLAPIRDGSRIKIMASGIRNLLRPGLSIVPVTGTE